MVKIRLSRTGAKNQPSYRIVAVDSHKKRDGRHLEILGHYDPKTKPATVKLKFDRIQHWQNHGAQLSATVRKIIEDHGKTT
jgi:small subunit ribosomal protein S16